jgi:cation:H+ antiporter
VAPDLLQEAPLGVALLLFAVSAAIIGFFGIRMTYLARDLAEATGLGEAFMGAVFIGATTSLSGIVASSTAAWQGDASLAVSNSLGGIAAQTLFLVLGDMVYRRANLEFAAASLENLMMGAQLMVLLCVLLVAFTLPSARILHVHPASVVLVVVYLFTLKLLLDTHQRPMWHPRITHGTVRESTRGRRTGGGRSRGRLFVEFGVCGAFVAGAGWLIASSGRVIIAGTGLSAGLMGGIFIAISTSLPELVVAVTAIRVGALTLAVGDIVGGNAFDTLFVAVSDFFYRDGPIYADAGSTERVWLACAMSMNAVLVMGLLYRERRGIGNIGMESVTMLVVYVGAVAYLSL